MLSNILIIDDDLVSQFATRYCIEQYNSDCTISTCANAEEGLALLSDLIIQGEELPDVIFLDLVMRNMNGWDFLNHLKKMTKGRSKPEVYILSAFTNVKDRAIAKKHKLISGYMNKPLTRNGLEKIFSATSKTDSSL